MKTGGTSNEYRALLSHFVGAVCLACVSGAALAAPDTQGANLFSADYLLRVFGSLLLVFGCLFGLLYLLKRMNRLPVGEHRAIRVLASLKVGAREKVMLLESGESQVLIGVAAGNVRTLHVLPQARAAQAQTQPEFDALLKQTVAEAQP